MNIPIREGDDTNAMEPALLTVPEALKQLGGISKWSLYQLIHSRQLESIRIGRRRLIPKTAITKLIEKLTREDLA